MNLQLVNSVHVNTQVAIYVWETWILDISMLLLNNMEVPENQANMDAWLQAKSFVKSN